MQLLARFRRDRRDPTDGWPWEIDPDLGPVLTKALHDPFFYAVGLRSGETIHFERAERTGNFLILHEHDADLPFPCPRGVQVRIDDIAWAADAPEGS